MVNYSHDLQGTEQWACCLGCAYCKHTSGSVLHLEISLHFFWMLSLRFLNFYLYLKDSWVNLIYVVGSEENTYLFFGFIFSLKIRIVEFSLLLEHDRVFFFSKILHFLESSALFWRHVGCCSVRNSSNYFCPEWKSVSPDSPAKAPGSKDQGLHLSFPRHLPCTLGHIHLIPC